MDFEYPLQCHDLCLRQEEPDVVLASFHADLSDVIKIPMKTPPMKSNESCMRSPGCTGRSSGHPRMAARPPSPPLRGISESGTQVAAQCRRFGYYSMPLRPWFCISRKEAKPPGENAIVTRSAGVRLRRGCYSPQPPQGSFVRKARLVLRPDLNLDLLFSSRFPGLL